MRKVREKMRKFRKKGNYATKTQMSRKIQNFLNKCKIVAKKLRKFIKKTKF